MTFSPDLVDTYGSWMEGAAPSPVPMPSPEPKTFYFRMLAGAVGVALLFGTALSSHAQGRDRIATLLEGHSDFRVRVQAALAAGRSADVSLRPALERALREKHPAVRAAAATALGKLGDQGARSALKRATQDSVSAVRTQAASALRELGASPPSSSPRVSKHAVYPPFEVMPKKEPENWGQTRYAVLLGDLVDRSGSGHQGLEKTFHQEVARRLKGEHQIAVFGREAELDGRARAEIRKRNLPFLRIEGNVSKVDRIYSGRTVSMRCEVSLMVLDAQNRTMRSSMRGAATSVGPRLQDRAAQDRQLARKALSGAVQSALTRVSDVLASGSGS